MSAKSSREARTRESNKYLDAVVRERRTKKALEALEQDNFQEEPHADLVMSKKAPKFQESLDKSHGKKRKARTMDYYRQKYGKSLQALIDEEQMTTYPPNYKSQAIEKSSFPPIRFCSVCGFFSAYTCTQCGMRFCNQKCLATHKDTRCHKWTG